MQRWNLPGRWVISARPAHPALVSEADLIAARDISAAARPAWRPGRAGRRRYPLAGLVICGICGRPMESAWSNGKPACRCRHGHTSAAPPDPDRAKNAYVREDRILARLPALYPLLAGAQGTTGRTRRRTRKEAGVRPAISTEEAIGYPRERQISLTRDPAAVTPRPGTTTAIKTVTGKAS